MPKIVVGTVAKLVLAYYLALVLDNNITIRHYPLSAINVYIYCILCQILGYTMLMSE